MRRGLQMANLTIAFQNVWFWQSDRSQIMNLSSIVLFSGPAHAATSKRRSLNVYRTSNGTGKRLK
jgi:hypothetical protein